MHRSLALGIDVGGTTVKATLVDQAGHAERFQRVATPVGDRSGRDTASLIAELVDDYRRAADGSPVHLVGVGVAVPGIVDESTGIVIESINLGWRNVPIRDLVRQRMPLPVAFAQDVRSGAYAETAADRPSTGVSVFVPIGTGIAAAIVIDGTALVSAGWAGEIGQILLTGTPARNDVPTPLTLERVASAAAIARRLHVAGAREAAELVRGGDVVATAVWADAVEALAESLAWCTAVLGAERIIVGGGLAESGALLLDPLEAAIHARLGTLRRPAVVAARLGDRAGAIGAGLLMHREHPQPANSEKETP